MLCMWKRWYYQSLFPCICFQWAIRPFLWLAFLTARTYFWATQSTRFVIVPTWSAYAFWVFSLWLPNEWILFINKSFRETWREIIINITLVRSVRKNTISWFSSSRFFSVDNCRRPMRFNLPRYCDLLFRLKIFKKKSFKIT